MNMHEKETLNCSILEAAIIKLVSVPLVRNLNYMTLTQNLPGSRRNTCLLNKANSNILRTLPADFSPSRKYKSGH